MSQSKDTPKQLRAKVLTAKREIGSRHTNKADLAIAHYFLGTAHYNGVSGHYSVGGLEQNHDLAFKSFNSAYEANPKHKKAIVAIGTCYLKGRGVEPSTKKATEFYKIASDLGSISSTYNLGYCLFSGGLGLMPNRELGLQYIEKAAAAGYADARTALQLIADNGDLVVKESKQQTSESKGQIGRAKQQQVSPLEQDKTSLNQKAKQPETTPEKLLAVTKAALNHKPVSHSAKAKTTIGAGFVRA